MREIWTRGSRYAGLCSSRRPLPWSEEGSMAATGTIGGTFVQGLACREFGFGTVACASTGNLAHAVAAHAAAAGLRAVTFVPAGLESGKLAATAVYGATLVEVDGTYDDVNRLCGEASADHPWAFVNVN